MNYTNIYDKLISRAKNRVLDGYVERHHIIPRCLGGNDDYSNLVALTPEEHFFAHVLLVKIYPANLNLISAVQKMTQGYKGKRTRKMYGWLKRRFAAYMSTLQTGASNSQYGTKWITNGISSVKISKDANLPNGWINGRCIKPKSTEWIDININKFEKSKESTLSAINVKLLDALRKNESISSALRSIGVKTSGSYYTRAKKLIKQYGLTEKFNHSNITW